MQKKKRKWLTPLIITVLLVGAGLFLAQTFIGGGDSTVTAFSPQMVTLEHTELSRMLSASGVVRSAETQHVFSTQTRPVQEILVDVGDRVEAGDLIIRLDMSHIENDIVQTELSLINAQRTTSEEERNNANAITNARTNVESARATLERNNLALSNARADLADAIEELNTPFDTYMLERVVADTELNLARRTEDFQTAEADLFEAIYDFDDYDFQNRINDSRINLQRRQSDLADAAEDLDEERRNAADRLDETALQNAITDAETNLDRRRNDEATASHRYFEAWHQWNLSFASPETQQAAQTAIDTARTQHENARRATEDAEAALERARNNLTTARRNHIDNAEDLRSRAITAAETRYNNAQNAVEDAQRNYDRAHSDLARARRNAETLASDRLTLASNNLQDARRASERAASDLYRASEDYTTARQDIVTALERSITDIQAQIATAEIGLRSAQETLAQAEARPATSGTNIQMQTANLQRLQNMLPEGQIKAPISGVVTQINTSVGAAASGVLLIIEDVDNLYVAANIREHSLSEVSLGLPALITTEVTGDRVYGAEITFISPRAVSPAGSTSVEFEIRAAIDTADQDVRIGMNAFINVVTDYRHDVFSVPLSAISPAGNVYTRIPGEYEYEILPIPVSVGLRTSTHAEVYGSGLNPGLNIFARAADARG
ncbi:MAG: efflux RND transporter periplasmic adaptor subunit [Defluviitaleaceae bacterium]|nr:efflux RND transporter periplasmic adaptor subunit [Defluviitaleaceae bacterium]